ncbi:MAG: hypothetical protein KAT83_01410 [Candidatus Aenigmarchaeota archaeon]|nr:hypothetical protein [Candidatus Aenigmarchaeota archaeon]
MPTYASSKIPPPKSWDEFEDIVTDVAKLLWKNPNVIRYGRTGQKQNGVDIVGEPVHIPNEFAGIQCKNLDTKLNIGVVKKEIQKAESFEPPIKEFILACTDKRDVSLQTEVMKISQLRKKSEQFSVIIWFWDDLSLELAGSSTLMEKHYPQFLKSSMTHDKVITMIKESEISDWKYDDEEGVLTYMPNVELTIKRLNTDSSADYYEPWLEHFVYKKGHRATYNILYGGSLIKKEYFVAVEGFRGYVPVPKNGDTNNPKLTKWKYKIGKIIHSVAGFTGSVYSYDSILKRANISVIDE